MIMFLDSYQDLIDKKMTDYEIMEISNITENQLKKYAVASFYQNFRKNTIKRNLIALHASQNFETEKSTKRSKCIFKIL